MPLNLSREDRRLVIIAGSLFLVCSLLAIFLTPGESDAQFATTYSTAPEGAKAAYLLLRESGYRIDRWEHPPAELANAKDTFLIVADPLEIPSQADRDALESFLSNGGQVLLAGSYAPVFVRTGASPAARFPWLEQISRRGTIVVRVECAGDRSGCGRRLDEDRLWSWLIW